MNNFQEQQYSNRQSTKFSFFLVLRDFFQHLVWVIIRDLDSSSEPKIWQAKTYQGDIIWHIYHPKTGRSACFSSEQEVRIWIEEQYYY